MNNEFDFSKEPGKTLDRRDYIKKYKPEITIVMPFFNDKKYIEQSVRCVLNQTFPLFELLIIDDGSKDKESLKLLDEVSKWDDRIKVYHKKNEGLAASRDFGASKSSSSCEYLFFYDSDDLIEKTYLECAYWTLQTNKEASWAYSDSVGFGSEEYIWRTYYNPENMEKKNALVATALIRKKDFVEVGGYGLREKAVNEDWNFWLKMISKNKYPVKMSYFAFWYRRKDQSGELSKANDNKKRTKEIINETRKQITNRKDAIQYPIYNYNWDKIEDSIPEITQTIQKNDNKINLLFIIPWMVMGGADKFNVDFINGLDRNKFNITIITTEPENYIYRQSYIDVDIYDLTSFIDMKYWVAFINYIITKNNINIIMNSNSEIGYSMLPYLKAKYPHIPIVDYIHMEEWYVRNGGYSRDSGSIPSVIDLTMTCNANSVKVLIDYFKRKKEELKTVYIGVDEELFNPKKYNINELKEEYKLPKDKIIISYICRLSYQKRPFLLLDIIKKYSSINDNVLFLIVGDGPLEKELKEKANKMNINDNLRFMGRISETQKIYSVSDITINCSIKEGLALTSYESLSMGVPVISSNVGGQKELINEDVGVIVECLQEEKDAAILTYSDEEIDQYVDAINKVIDNLNKYKKKCRKRILSGFTLNHMKKNMNIILEEVYKKPNKEKIKNGTNLTSCIDVTKELIVKEFIQISYKYSGLCSSYKEKYVYGLYSKEEQIKFILWKNPFYRLFVRVTKKIGLFGLAKKILKRNK